LDFFSFYRQNDKSGYLRSNLGPIRWMSPEAYKYFFGKHKQDVELQTADDVWSFGILFLELYTNQMPYSDYETLIEFENAFRNGLLSPILYFPQSLDINLTQIMAQCFSEPSARPTFKTLHKQLHTLFFADMRKSQVPKLQQ